MVSFCVLLQPLSILPTYLCSQVLRSSLGFPLHEIREELCFLRFVDKRRAHLPRFIERGNCWMGNHGGKNEITFQNNGGGGFGIGYCHGGKRCGMDRCARNG